MTSAAKPAATYQPRRGRPSSEQVALLEANLLRIARDLFLEKGYAETSMEAVVSALGVSKATLYSRYSTKAELFDAIVTERLDTWEKETAAERGGTDLLPAEQLHRYATRFLTEMRKPERLAFHRLLRTEAARSPELAQRFYAQGFQGAVTWLSRLLISGAGADWPLQDAEQVARLFLSALVGWFDIESMAGPVSDEACASAVDRLSRVFIGGRAAW